MSTYNISDVLCCFPLQTIKGVTSPIQSVSFNSSENWVGAGSKTGVVKVFDLEEDKSQSLLFL